MKSTSVVMCLVGLLLLSTSVADARTWTRANDRKIEADFVSRDANTITLRGADGKEFAIKMHALSEDDRKYVKQLTKSEDTKPKEEGASDSLNAKRLTMAVLPQVFEWVVTITGILALLMLVVTMSQRGETALTRMMRSVSTLVIGIGAVCALLYLLFLHYQMTYGVLSIPSIGFYVAIGSILVMLVQGWCLKAGIFKSVGLATVHPVVATQDRASNSPRDGKNESHVSDQWYYIEANERRGPVSIEHLRQSQLNPATLLWKKGMASWKQASQVLEVSSSVEADEPPPLPK